MTALPSTIGTGHVTGRFGDAMTGEEGYIPATEIAVTFTPRIALLLNRTAPLGLVMRPIVCSIDSDGYLNGPNGSPGVTLIATDDEDNEPTGWTYFVSFSIGVEPGPFRSLDLAVPGGAEIDLPTVIPAQPAAGVSLSAAQSAQVASQLAIGAAAEAATNALLAASGRYPDKQSNAVAWLNDQLNPLVRPTGRADVQLSRLYPIEYTGPVEASFAPPAGYATAAGTYISIGDPADLLPTFRGLAFGRVTGIANPENYRVQGCKVTDALYPLGPSATPDTGGYFAVDLSSVETWRAGSWAFRLELPSAPGVAVGGIWPLGDVYTGLTVELHEISDDDYLVASTAAPVSGAVKFLSSTPGYTRVTVKDSGTDELLGDTQTITGNIRSFIVETGQPGYGTRFAEQCYVYDQAVALCAALAIGDRTLAAHLMRGLARLQTPSGDDAGGFIFSGRQGSATYGDPAYRTGAHAIALFAALAYAHTFPGGAGDHARAVATAALGWLDAQLSGSGLYTGGNGIYTTDGAGGQLFTERQPITWCSTEHNIDAYFALKLAGRTVDAATLAANMMTHLWNSSTHMLNQGIHDGAPDTAQPLDCHSWGGIFLADAGFQDYAVATLSDDALDPFHATRTAPNGRVVSGYATAFDSAGYPGMIPHVWWEGTFSVAYAMAKIGDKKRQAQIMDNARLGQNPDGSYPYVSDHDATYELVPYRSVASTTWAVLANVGHGIFDAAVIV